MSTCIAVHELCTEAGLEAEVAQQLESEEITVGILLRASLVERREILRSMGLRFGQIMSLNQALEHRKQGAAAEGGGAAEEAVPSEAADRGWGGSYSGARPGPATPDARRWRRITWLCECPGG